MGYILKKCSEWEGSGYFAIFIDRQPQPVSGRLWGMRPGGERFTAKQRDMGQSDTGMMVQTPLNRSTSTAIRS